MSKKFKGKVCVYCGVRTAASGDHIFARGFFLEQRRAGLPKVPACGQCNGDKSALEHYLTAVLPFGGLHDDASSTLETMVADRLAKNTPLHKQLQKGRSTIWVRGPSGLDAPRMMLPFDGEKSERLFGFIVKGLAWHHWRVVLGPDCCVEVSSLTGVGERFFGNLLAQRAAKRVNETLGGGAISYEGAQGIDNPQVTVWRISMYGGVVLAGDGAESRDATSSTGGLTGPRTVFENAERKSKWLSGRGGQK